MTFHRRLNERLLPLSLSSNIEEALKEWEYDGVHLDHHNLNNDCELCDKKNIRYHFLIKNKSTGHTLWIGSHCIEQYNIPDITLMRLHKKKMLMRKNETLEQMNSRLNYEKNRAYLERLARAQAIAFQEFKKDLADRWHEQEDFIVFCGVPRQDLGELRLCGEVYENKILQVLDFCFQNDMKARIDEFPMFHIHRTTHSAEDLRNLTRLRKRVIQARIAWEEQWLASNEWPRVWFKNLLTQVAPL